MTSFPCTVTTPPQVEDGAVTFTVVHDPSGEAFQCKMRGFDDLVIDSVPHGMTPWPEGDTRGVVAEAAVHYARENRSMFEDLFSLLPRTEEE